MGDIADMMLEGVLCPICGEVTGDGQGFPVPCDSCTYDDDSDDSDIESEDL